MGLVLTIRGSAGFSSTTLLCGINLVASFLDKNCRIYGAQT